MKDLRTKIMLLLCLSCCMIFTACDKEEPVDIPIGAYEKTKIAKFLIQSADNKCEVVYTNDGTVSKMIIPAEGGVFHFKLNDNAKGIKVYGGKAYQLTFYDFTPQDIIEVVDWNIAPNIDDDMIYDAVTIAYARNVILEESRNDKKTICTFGYYETTDKGFTVKIDPNPKNEVRAILISTNNYPEVDYKEDWIWQLPKQTE